MDKKYYGHLSYITGIGTKIFLSKLKNTCNGPWRNIIKTKNELINAGLDANEWVRGTNKYVTGEVRKQLEELNLKWRRGYLKILNGYQKNQCVRVESEDQSDCY